MCMFPTKQGYPCGKCIDCLSKKRNDWSIRLQHEYCYWLNRQKGTYMALLTYADEHLPLTPSGTPTLRQRDVQLFLKRLRKALSKDGLFVRFFYCGEYGPSTKRPHYHLLLFGFPLEWSKKKVFDYLQKAWPNGFIGNKLGLVNEGGIHYCTKYMINKAIKIDDPDCEKPFNRMSKGLGMSFLYTVEEDSHGLHKGSKRKNVEERYNPERDLDSAALYEYARSLTDEGECIKFATYIRDHYMDRIMVNGSKFKMPRYYRDRIFDGCERYLINFSDRYLHWLPKEREYFERYGDYDATHEVPMKILMAQEKTTRLLGKYIKESQI